MFEPDKITRNGAPSNGSAQKDTPLREASKPLMLQGKMWVIASRSRGSLTMMQSCASAAKLRGGGPILENGVKPWPASGDHHLGSSSETDDILFVRLRELVLSAFARHAARKTTPAGTSPVVTIRHSAISSFLASATIRVLRVPSRASAVRARYHCASALSF